MRCTYKYSIALLVIVITTIFIIGCRTNYSEEIIFNEKFIYNLYNPTNQKNYATFNNAPILNTPEEVFSFIFSHLDKEVFVYPTENYYYFEFKADDKNIAGNIGLFANIRDDAKISFAYFDKSKVRNPDNASFAVREYDEKDGVLVEKIDDFKYSIKFKGKEVIFKLNEFGIDPSKKAKLNDDEVFIGGSFDESGIKFALIYNNVSNSFYWILNEDDFVPETFTEYTKNIIIGDRTGFAFYNDEENNRRILFGVNFSNTLKNNWYDGPFDQLPDNYIKIDKINITKYLEKVYPGIENYVDKYSYFSDKPGVRTSLNFYYDYDDEAELIGLVSHCKSSSNNSKFYACITTPNRKRPN